MFYGHFSTYKTQNRPNFTSFEEFDPVEMHDNADLIPDIERWELAEIVEIQQGLSEFHPSRDYEYGTHKKPSHELENSPIQWVPDFQLL